MRDKITAAMDAAVRQTYPNAMHYPSPEFYELRLDEWTATLSAAGFAIVPVEPTAEMLRDATDAMEKFATANTAKEAYAVWGAMLLTAQRTISAPVSPASEAE